MALIVGSAEAVTLTRGPYLQLLTTTTVSIVWNTDTSAACSLNLGPIGGPSTTIASASGTVCVIPVSGLTPGAQYTYTPLADGTPVQAASTFHTNNPNAPFTFLVFGDSGKDSATHTDQDTVRDRMRQSPADFILHTGDMVYPDGAAGDWNPRFFTPYADLLRRLVLWPCLGNHDVHAAGGNGQPWRDAFYTPANNPSQSENYYSFDYGSAHVVVLDSNDSTGATSKQYVFLNQDLATSTARWKFVVFHHTIYSSAPLPGHGSSLSLRANLRPLFDQNHVDLVFMGHDHDYERTKPLVADQPVAPGAGTTYVTTGGGGNGLYPAGTSAFTAYSESTYHFVRVAIDGDSLTLNMIRSNAAVGDTFLVTKGTAPTTSTTASTLASTTSSTTTSTRTTTTRTTTSSTATTTTTTGTTARITTTTASTSSTTTITPTTSTTSSASPTTVTTGTPTTTTSPTASTTTSIASSSTSTTETILTSTTTTAASSTSTTVPPPSTLAVPPQADTYIEAGSQASCAHGGASQLAIDATPQRVAYLQFKLPALAGAVTNAQLDLFCTDSSADGGTVYAIPDSSWTEGSGAECSATGPIATGIRWTDVDRNGDGTLDWHDASPLVPDAAREIAAIGRVDAGAAYRVDVTEALASGTEAFTLAIVSQSNNGAAYASREDTHVDHRPVLQLRSGTPPPSICSDGVIDAAEQCDGRTDAECPGTCRSDCTCPPFACLATPGALTTLEGLYRRSYRGRADAQHHRLDARRAVFVGTPGNRFPLVVRSHDIACLAGGRVTGSYDRHASWQQAHASRNAAITFKRAAGTVDGFRIDNVATGVRLRGTGTFTIKNVWMSYVRDVCVENNRLLAGLVDDSLFDGCYSAFSASPTRRTLNGHDRVWTIRNSLVHLSPMPEPLQGTIDPLGAGDLFPVDRRGPQLALHDNVFLVERPGQGGAAAMTIAPERLQSCSNNLMVWLGNGPYPVPLPSCIALTTDRRAWDSAVAAWRQRHEATFGGS